MKTIFTLLFAASAMFAQAQNRLVVTRVGDGTTALAGNTAKVTLMEYTSADIKQTQSTGVVELSSTGVDKLTLAGPLGATKSEGQLGLSTDGAYLLVLGYDQEPGVAADGIGAAARTGNKLVARIANDGTVDYSTKFSNLGTFHSPRSVASVDGSAFYVNIEGGTNQIGYVALGGTALTGIGTVGAGARTVNIYGDQLYAIPNYNNMVYSTPALPTEAGATGTTIFNPNTSVAGFTMLDMDATADWNGTGLDVIYIGNLDGNFLKWYWNGTDWVAAGTAYGSVSGITVVKDGANARIYAVSGNGTVSNNCLVALTDDKGYNGDITDLVADTLATAGENYAFRGVAVSNFSGTVAVKETKAAKASIKVFPNPASEVIQVTGITGSTVQLSLVDLNGRVVLTKEYSDAAIVELNVQSIAKGTYVLKVVSDKAVVSSLVVIQ